MDNIQEKDQTPYKTYSVSVEIKHPRKEPENSDFPVAVICESIDGRDIKTADNLAEFQCVKELFVAIAWYSINNIAEQYLKKSCVARAE